MKEQTDNRPPSFQFYPDIFQAHTRRLSDTAYRIYHEILCWMWLQAPDYCSIPKDPESIACLIALPCDRIATALQEIQNPHAPLLKERGDKYVSNRLHKEYEKLQDRRDKAVMAANKRWKEPMRTQCERNANASFEQCTPTPSSSPTPTPAPQKKERTFKQWNEADLTESVKKANTEGILDAHQAQRFIDYWTEPRASGKPRISAQEAWRTKSRLKTWADRNNVGSPQGTPKSKPSAIRESRDIILGRAIDALEHASEHGPEAVDRCIEGLRDKYRDYGKNREGKTVVGEAVEIWKSRKEQG